jgi:predicted transcriptional regulator YdeE
MDYQYIIAKLEDDKRKLTEKLENKELPKTEYETIKHSIENYDYIIQLTEMNHFERGIAQ